MKRLAFTVVLGAVTLGMMFGHWSKQAKGHDIYTDWKMPGSNMSCCNDSDCRPVRAWKINDDQWIALVDGREVPIPPEKILDRKSPDGRSHWCGAGMVTYCFLPGEIRS